jgi:hypothetical protein
MPFPFLAVLGIAVVGGGIALAVGSKGGVVEVTAVNAMSLQLKPPVALLIYRDEGVGRMARKIFGEVSGEYGYVQFAAMSTTALSAFMKTSGEQYGMDMNKFDEVFGLPDDLNRVNMAAFIGVGAPGTFPISFLVEEGALENTVREALRNAVGAMSDAPPSQGPGAALPIPVLENLKEMFG